MEGALLIMTDKQIIKIDDNTVAEISERKAIYDKTRLEERRLAHVKAIADIDELLSALN